MTTFITRWMVAAVLGLASLVPVYALEAGDAANLKAGTVLSLPSANNSGARTLTIAHVHPVRSDDGVWYQILGSSADGQEQLVYADLSAKPPKVEVMVKRVNLRKLVDRPRKFLDAVEDDEKGELTLDGVVYRYNDKESDDGSLEPDGNAAQAQAFNYLVFTSTQDPSLSIQVMRWTDEKFDAYLIQQVSAADAKLQ
ncbi:hypothetical protein [Rhodoferax saidenbachensis]|uniref:Uncharacterized protein n=1 Tax=Rhodoferax saidenbachensis TaxID=1484693 RepID=A0ABU1ZKQ3_9BURK|nr:hypothetical protein [Rhodoferax saidenbachensis]MDR7305973.1 hypothetical protein [Rhodoferax saidenbachensis]